MTPELEELAVRIVALPLEQRHALDDRVKSLSKRVRSVAERLTGRTDASKLHQLLMGGNLYNEHGEPVAFIKSMNVETVAAMSGMARMEVTIVAVER